MASKWRECTLGDVLTLQRGFDLPVGDRVTGPVPVLASTGQVGWHDKAPVTGPGVVIGRSGSLGGGQFIDGPFWPLNTTLWVKDFRGNDPRFCYYLLRTIDFLQFNVGSGVPTLNRNHVHPLRVSVPILAEQQRIVDVLAALDDRIEVLAQTNATLEAITQALFKSWFVDFDPVRAKSEGREPDGIDAATAALFPSELEHSELGQIPKGWRPVAFGDVATLAKGSVTPMTRPDQLFHHYSLPAFDAGQLPAVELGEAIKSNKTPVPPGAVLVSKLNPHIPRVWFVGDEPGANAVCSTEFLVWIPKSGASGFVCCLAVSPAFNSAMRQLVTGTSNSHQRVNADQLARVEAAIASDAAITGFDRIARPLLQQVEHNRRRAATLAKLRDTLLPRLISGKLRLPEAVALTEDAVA